MATRLWTINSPKSVAVPGSYTMSYTKRDSDNANTYCVVGARAWPQQESNTTTTWEVNIDTVPTTTEGLAVSVIDWNQNDINVQRGLFTMVNPSFTGELISGTDFTVIFSTRTMLFVTDTTHGSSSEPHNDSMFRASFTDVVGNMKLLCHGFNHTKY